MGHPFKHWISNCLCAIRQNCSLDTDFFDEDVFLSKVLTDKNIAGVEWLLSISGMNDRLFMPSPKIDIINIYRDFTNSLSLHKKYQETKQPYYFQVHFRIFPDQLCVTCYLYSKNRL